MRLSARVAKVARVGVTVGVVAVSGCSGEAVNAGGDPGRITHRAVAAVALEHLPTDTASRAASHTSESTPSEQGGEAESEFADDLSLWCDREHLDARPVKQLD